MAQCSTDPGFSGKVPVAAVDPGTAFLEPFQYLVHEQAKSIVAIQELQQEVGSLLLFRQAVLAALPHLQQQQQQTNKAAQSVVAASPNNSAASKLQHSWNRKLPLQIPQQLRSYEAPANAVIDSGFSTEANSNSSPRSSRVDGQSDASATATTSATSSAFKAATPASSPMEKVLSQHLKRVRNRISRLKKDENRLVNLLSHAQSVSSTNGSPDETFSRKAAVPVTSGDKDELWDLLEEIEKKGKQMRDQVAWFQNNLEKPLEKNQGLQAFISHLEKDLQYLRKRQQEVEEQIQMFQDQINQKAESKRPTNERAGEEQFENSTANQRKREEELKDVTRKIRETQERFRERILENEESGEKTTNQRREEKESGEKTTNQRAGSVSQVTVTRLAINEPQNNNNNDNNNNDNGMGSKKRVSFQEGVVSVSQPIGSHASSVNRVVNREKVSAVLRLSNPVQLQRQLIHALLENQALRERISRQQEEVTSRDAWWHSTSHETAQQLTHLKEENEDLRFQLMEQKIELEGTKARLRLLSRNSTPSPSPAVTVPAYSRTASCQTDSLLTSPVCLNTGTQTEVLVDRTRSLPRVVDAAPKVKLIRYMEHDSSGHWDDDDKASVEKRSYGSRIPTPIKPVKNFSKRELPNVSSMTSINSQSLKGRRIKDKDTPPATPPNKKNNYNNSSSNNSNNNNNQTKTGVTPTAKRIDFSDKINGNFLESTQSNVRTSLNSVRFHGNRQLRTKQVQTARLGYKSSRGSSSSSNSLSLES